jgi:hypothetical protein
MTFNPKYGAWQLPNFGATVSSASNSTCLPQEGIVNLEFELIHKVKLLTV